MKTDISPEELNGLDGITYIIADIRDSASFALGHIGGAVNISADVSEGAKTLPSDKTIIVCCKSGVISRDYADRLREMGFCALNLSGGYALWLAQKLES